MAASKETTVALLKSTPAMAQSWLDRNSPKNRKLNPRTVQHYRRQMRNGYWTLSDQAVSFNTAGELINGQHRLSAQVAEDLDITWIVVRNLPESAMLILDGAAKRTTDQNLLMAGKQYHRGVGSTVRSAINGLETGFGAAATITDPEIADFMDKYGDEVELVHRLAGSGGKMWKASVRGALARATITYRKDETKLARLMKFAEVLTTGLMVPGDDAAILLRNVCFERHDLNSGKNRGILYGLAEHAIKTFLACREVRDLQPVSEEIYPLPGEVA